MAPKLRAPRRIPVALFFFFFVLTILIALSAIAQQTGLSQSTQKPVATFVTGTPPAQNGSPHIGPSSLSARQAAVSQDEGPRSKALFLPGVTYGPLPAQSAVAIADVNGDGKADVLTVGSSFNVSLGNGDGTLQPPIIDTNIGGGSLVVADVNGDGKLDVVIAGEPATVSVLLGNGDGTFQPPISYNVEYGQPGLQSLSLAVADVNGDGKPDIVISGAQPGNYADGVVAVLLGNGDGTFQPPVFYDSGGVGTDSVVIADMNGDGTFQPAVNYSSGEGYSCGGPNGGGLSVADLNGDGKLDVVVVNQGCGAIAVMLGNGDGTLQSGTSYNPGGGPCCVAIADANHDGKPDLLVVNINWNGQTYVSAVGILQGNGDGTFQAAVNVPTNGNLSDGIAVGYINGDRKPDLAVSNSGTGAVSVMWNDSGSAPPLTALSSSPNPSVFGQPITLT